jgi:transposase
MNRFPGPKSILVMDNASWHHDEKMGPLCQQYGILLWYLPPYSPDFNPIEAFFGDLKTYIRRRYRYEGGDEMTEEEFKGFLASSATEISERLEQLCGHFRQAMLRFHDGEESIDYNVLYASALEEYLATGTVG